MREQYIVEALRKSVPRLEVDPLEFRVLKLPLRHQQCAVPLEDRRRLILYRFVLVFGHANRRVAEVSVATQLKEPPERLVDEDQIDLSAPLLPNG